MDKTLINLYLFPPVLFFSSLEKTSTIMIEAHENYVKQSFRNRFQILTPQGVQNLTIPVVSSQKKQHYKDVKIDNSVNWELKNYNALKTSYSNSPYFEDYYPFMEQIFSKKHHFLFDLNFDLFQFCLKSLNIKKPIELTMEFQLNYSEINDLREKSSKKNDRLHFSFSDIKSYKQVFGNEFVGNLSVLDLIFCKGPFSLKYL